MDSDIGLPKAAVNKFINEALPEDLRCSNEVREMIFACCGEFIQMVSSEATDICNKENRTNITPSHVLSALKVLGFNDYISEVESAHKDHEDRAGKARAQKKALTNTHTREDLMAIQQKLFNEAKANYIERSLASGNGIENLFGAFIPHSSTSSSSINTINTPQHQQHQQHQQHLRPHDVDGELSSSMSSVKRPRTDSTGDLDLGVEDLDELDDDEDVQEVNDDADEDDEVENGIPTLYNNRNRNLNHNHNHNESIHKIDDHNKDSVGDGQLDNSNVQVIEEPPSSDQSSDPQLHSADHDQNLVPQSGGDVLVGMETGTEVKHEESVEQNNVQEDDGGYAEFDE